MTEAAVFTTGGSKSMVRSVSTLGHGSQRSWARKNERTKATPFFCLRRNSDIDYGCIGYY